jgi:hypothetical protein
VLRVTSLLPRRPELARLERRVYAARLGCAALAEPGTESAATRGRVAESKHAKEIIMSQNRYTAVFAAIAVTAVQTALFATTTAGPAAAPQAFVVRAHAAARAPLELVHAAVATIGKFTA